MILYLYYENKLLNENEAGWIIHYVSLVVGYTLMLWRAKDPKVVIIIQIKFNFKNTAKTMVMFRKIR